MSPHKFCVKNDQIPRDGWIDDDLFHRGFRLRNAVHRVDGFAEQFVMHQEKCICVHETHGPGLCDGRNAGGNFLGEPNVVLVCKGDEVDAALCGEPNCLLKVLAYSETLLIFDPGKASIVEVRL